MKMTSKRVKAESDAVAAEILRRLYPEAIRITVRLVGKDWYEYTVMEDDHE